MSKTAKGLAEASGKTSQLSRALRNLLKEIDGRTPIADLAEEFTKLPEAKLLETLKALEQDGFVRELQRAGAPTCGAAQESASDEGAELDFTAIAGSPVEQPSDYFAARRAAAARAEAEATARGRAEGEAAARAQAEAEAAAKAIADAEAAAKAEAKRAQAAALVRAHHETKAKQAAEDKAKAEAEAAELRRTLEEERKAREELERKAKEDATRVLREAEEWARRKAGEDADRRAREQIQHRPPEATDLPKVTIPEPPAGEAQEERTAEERAQGVARRFQQEQAKRDAERQAQREETESKRAAKEAALREEARAAEDAKQERLQKEEERRRDAEEAERRREEEKARTRGETLAKARVAADAAMRARQQAMEEELATERRRESATGVRPAEPASRTPRRARRGARITAVLFLLVAGAFAAAYFMPLDAASFERQATARFGTPVKIGSAHLSLLPMPALRFERVSIGPAGDVKIAAVSSRAGVGAIFDKQNAFKTLELEGVQIPASWLGAALWGKGGSDAFRVEHVIARGVTVEAPGLELPVLNVDATLDSAGALQFLSAQTADRKQTFNLTMTDGKAAVEISARPFTLPFTGGVQLDDLVGSGTLTPSELALSRLELGAFGGAVKGTARVRWGASWSVDGEFVAASMNPRLATASLVSTGRLEGKGTFAMRAPTPDKLHEAARIDATFTVRNGTLGFVDLTRALQGGNARGGTTSFTSLDGNASLSGGTVRLAQLRLAAGLLNATGEATVDPQQNLDGRLQVDLTSQARGVLTLGGTVAAPQVKR